MILGAMLVAAACDALPGPAGARTADGCRPAAGDLLRRDRLGRARAGARRRRRRRARSTSSACRRSASDKTQMRSASAGPIRALGRELPRARGGQRHRVVLAGSRARAAPGTRPASRPAAAWPRAGFDVSRRRHVGRERALLGRPRRHGPEPAEHARPRARPLRRRRRPAGEGRGVRQRHRAADRLRSTPTRRGSSPGCWTPASGAT